MTMQADNHGCKTPGDHSRKPDGDVAWINRGETRWMMIEKADLDHDLIRVNDSFHEGFKAAYDICQDPKKLERFRRFCDAEQHDEEVFRTILDMTATWIAGNSRIVNAFMRPKDSELYFEFITAGGDYDEDVSEGISELLLRIYDACPNARVTIDGIAEEVYSGPEIPTNDG